MADVNNKKPDGLKIINWESTETVSFQKQHIIPCGVLLIFFMV